MRRYTIHIEKEEGVSGYTASVQEWPGCVAEGESVIEALLNLTDSIEAWVWACVESDTHVPPPEDVG